VTARAGLAAALALLLLIPLPSLAEPKETRKEPVLGRLLAPDPATMQVRRESWRCQPGAEEGDSVVLMTLGSTGEIEGEEHFHPVASLAFDRYFDPTDPGEWSALWIYGPAGAGAWNHFRAVLPVPLGRPHASTSDLERLEKRQHGLETGDAKARLQVPDPVIHLANLEQIPRAQGFWGGLRRVLGWANVVNPAQFLYRTYLIRRKDRSERNFQRTYLALQWMQDVGFSGSADADWVGAMSELRFHLLRNRSFYGQWLDHADGRELVYNYESDTRRKLGKSSSWLQSAANEHSLRYQPIYRYTANGAAYPMGGVLYYDPQLEAQPDPGWWKVANPFDLPYNPHTDPAVQRLAKENPDELIPLAVYTYQTNLLLRPIIAVDFFAPANPRDRERSQQMMVMAKQWLAITTSPLSIERLPYRLIAWAANKKGFTLLVDKSSRHGNEELRLALESNLYFDPALRERLQKAADARVFNPLIQAGSAEERLAHIQYESLRADEGRALCSQVLQVREAMARKLGVPEGLTPEERRREAGRRLQAWHYQIRLADYVAQPLGDPGSLRALEQPLERVGEVEPFDPARLEKLLRQLYAALYRQQLGFPEEAGPEELASLLEQTREAWSGLAADQAAFEVERERVERKAREAQEKERVKREKEQRELLADFLKSNHRQMSQTLNAGCGTGSVPGELEAHLSILEEVLATAYAEPAMRNVLNRQAPRLRRDLNRLEAMLDSCPSMPDEPWLAESHRACLEQTQLLRQELNLWTSVNGTRGGD